MLIKIIFIFILLQIFSNVPCCGFLDTPIILKWTSNFQIHAVFKVSLLSISHLNAFFSEITLCVFSFFWLYWGFQWLSQRSLGKCHTALENMWVIFKYLLILISNKIPQWEQDLYVSVLSCAQSFSPVWLFVTPWTVNHQTPLSMGFSRQEHWSGLTFPSPAILLDHEIYAIYFTFPDMFQCLLDYSLWELE